jgi:hypothetical protein
MAGWDITARSTSLYVAGVWQRGDKAPRPAPGRGTCDTAGHPLPDITQLVVLAAPAGARQRGIRLRTVGRPQYVYFFARPAVVQQLVEQFSCHGVRFDGQLASDRIPDSGGSWFYRESAPIQPHSQRAANSSKPVSAAGNGDRMNEMQAPI